MVVLAQAMVVLAQDLVVLVQTHEADRQVKVPNQSKERIYRQKY